MTDDERQVSKIFIDENRSAHLCDVGLADFMAALCVTAAGEDQVWLVNLNVLGEDGADHGDAAQPHEQLGPLPTIWRHRVELAPARCGRPRADGRPCRQYVGVAGRPCVRHADQASAP